MNTMTTMIVTKNLKLTKILFIFIGLFNVLHANSVNFTFKEGHKVELGEVFEITWKSDLPLGATVNLSYSYSGSNWYSIEKVVAEEESYFWIIPENINVRDGLISLRIKSSSAYGADYANLALKGFVKNVTKSNSYQSNTPKKASTSSNEELQPISDCFWGCIVPYYLLALLFS